MNILMVLTSHEQLGDTGKKTGFWLEEFAAPYYVLKEAGHRITLASPAGGQPPLDPKSDEPDAQTDATRRFQADEEAVAALGDTERLADVDPSRIDAVFFPGGHGPMWDLAEDRDVKRIIEALASAGKPVAAVCHGPAVFRRTLGSDGRSLVSGKRVTGFTNAEEETVGLTEVVPFLLEDMLREQGADFSRADAFTPHVVRDGLLITGQNPASSEPAAEALLEALVEETEPAA
ncbi:type 1 glutamine amidotransferase domain-containing protein [Sphingomonas arenae]|uniref:type 1 glutamine amidotransferase domain-containing protein n=1 Tax=Sphingomonas arenae TaxID=2812555 RepID=UPI0019675A90|nr:type 1 glutamine amidotransferase domain-containing protein [Sphingomonas arenae]